jgi:hypothetical protein
MQMRFGARNFASLPGLNGFVPVGFFPTPSPGCVPVVEPLEDEVVFVAEEPLDEDVPPDGEPLVPLDDDVLGVDPLDEDVEGDPLAPLEDDVLGVDPLDDDDDVFDPLDELAPPPFGFVPSPG